MKILVALLSLLVFAESYNILVLFTHPGKSHTDTFQPLIKGLSRKGHNVTAITYTSLKNPPPEKYTEILLGADVTNIFNLADYHKNNLYLYYFLMSALHQAAEETCTTALKSREFRAFLRENRTFDLVISEHFNTNCYLGVVHKFRAPLIAISSCPLLPWTNAIVANSENPSYVRNVFLYSTANLSFWRRVENLLVGLAFDAFYHLVRIPSDDRYARKLFPDDAGLPSVAEIAAKTSLVLVNSHFALNAPRPLVPAVVEIGGVHIEQHNKLTRELDKWINESAEGVIYFSLGSMIKSHTFPEEKRRAFLNAFARLPQRVLWKWENETMPDRPDNVRIQKWMPQLDVLCHPNVRAFISHGGLLGTTEAVHCGVPIVVMPQYGDQHTNAKAVETTGAGVVLELWDADEEAVFGALKQVLEPSFRQGAQELSARFRDRPLPPLETAIYWIEYVARHRGAHHMRTAAVDMPFYKYLLLDVILFLLVVSLISVSISCCIMRTAYARIFRKKSQPNTKRKTN